MNLRRGASVVVGALLAAALVLACSTPSASRTSTAQSSSRSPSFETFEAAFLSGADCARLFEARNALPPKDPQVDRMNDMLGSVDCMTPTSKRVGPVAPAVGTGTPAPINYVKSYRVSFANCGASPAKLYAEAGTRDARKAALWLADTYVPGLEQDGSADGCHDELLGKPNRFPR